MEGAASQFIEGLYAKRFGRERPDVIKTIEEIARPAERHHVGASRASSVTYATGIALARF